MIWINIIAYLGVTWKQRWGKSFLLSVATQTGETMTLRYFGKPQFAAFVLSPSLKKLVEKTGL